MDFYFSEAGDIAPSPSGDIAMTDTAWRDSVQQAYIRLMTDEGDYLMYETLGASLSQLYGMPQSAATGSLGIRLITNALVGDNKFTASQVSVTAVPVDMQTIRFDVSITSGSLQQITISLEQNLGLV